MSTPDEQAREQSTRQAAQRWADLVREADQAGDHEAAGELAVEAAHKLHRPDLMAKLLAADLIQELEAEQREGEL